MTEMLSKYLTDHFDAADTIESHQAMAGRLSAGPRRSPGRTAKTMGRAPQAVTPASLARPGPRPPCDGMVAGTDRRPTGAGTRSHGDQPRVNLPLHLPPLGPEGLLAPPLAAGQAPPRTARQARRQPARLDQASHQHS